MEQLMSIIFIFITGLCLGSFVNVCIWRIPRNESIIYPGSHCTRCLRQIPWYDNLPFLSYLILGRRCRFCRTKISIRYFIVEILTGLLCLILYIKFGISLNFFISIILLLWLLTISGIDWEWQIIPDELNLTLIVVGLLVSFSNPFLRTGGFTFSRSDYLNNFLNALFSGLISGFIFWGLAFFGEKIFKREALGGGDIKLITAIGTVVGLNNVWWTIFLSAWCGSIYGIAGLIFHKRLNHQPIPFGPFLSLGTYLTLILQPGLNLIYHKLIFG